MNKHAIAASLISVQLLLVACSSPEKAPEKEKSEPTAAAPAPEAPKPEAPPVDAPKAEAPKAEAPKKEAPKTETAKAAPGDKPATPATPPKETTLSSGLKIIDSKVGQGNAVKSGDVIQVHYTGWLYENGKRGSQFDSSVGKKPFEFMVGQGVIQGWSEGVVGMKPGGKRELIIPPVLGYGARGFPGAIPPNSTLNFEIELLKVLQ